MRSTCSESIGDHDLLAAGREGVSSTGVERCGGNRVPGIVGPCDDDLIPRRIGHQPLTRAEHRRADKSVRIRAQLPTRCRRSRSTAIRNRSAGRIPVLDQTGRAPPSLAESRRPDARHYLIHRSMALRISIAPGRSGRCAGSKTTCHRRRSEHRCWPHPRWPEHSSARRCRYSRCRLPCRNRRAR